jgi:23S rRNA C2498 (ribose-2'-O)-methylase RlmM
MPIAKEKSRTSPKRVKSLSADQVAEGFCEEMIQNLKRNVPENKQRTAL